MVWRHGFEGFASAGVGSVPEGLSMGERRETANQHRGSGVAKA